MGYRRNSKVVLAMDIETLTEAVTSKDIAEYMANWEPPANYKKDEAIANARAKAEAEAVTALTKKRIGSFDGKRMISCAFGEAGSEGAVNVQAWASEDSKIICEGVNEYLTQYEGSDIIIVGYNHIKFDLVELAKQFYLNNMRLAIKPSKWDVVDLHRNFFDYGVGLKSIARGLKFPQSGRDGSMVRDWYLNGDWQEIIDYNKEDVYLTIEVYRAMDSVFTLF